MKVAAYAVLVMCAAVIILGISLWWVSDIPVVVIGALSTICIGAGIAFGALAIDLLKEDK